MLVLSRRQSERIRIGDDVVIQIVQIRGGQVRVGIEAPRTVNVVREELIAVDERPQLVSSLGRSQS